MDGLMAPAPRGRGPAGWLTALAAGVLLLPSCSTDGSFTILGYSTRPNYDTNICTVRVPIFENRTFYQGVEFDLTKAIIRDIEQKTPYKVVHGSAAADTELTGTIRMINRGIVLVNPNNSGRAIETTMEVDVCWKDLRTGEYLSRRSRRPGEQPYLDPQDPLLPPPGPGDPVAPPGLPGDPVAVAPAVPGMPLMPAVPTAPGEVFRDPSLPPQAIRPIKPPPVGLRAVTVYHPELGQSMTTALQKNVDEIATRVVGLMEVPW